MYNDGIVQAASARLNNSLRWHREDRKVISEARNALLAARLERAIQEALYPVESGFKKLADEDRARLAEILLNGR